MGVYEGSTQPSLDDPWSLRPGGNFRPWNMHTIIVVELIVIAYMARMYLWLAKDTMFQAVRYMKEKK